MFIACFVGRHKGMEYSLFTDGGTEAQLIKHAKQMMISLGITRKIKWMCLWRCGQKNVQKRKKKDKGSA